MVSVLANVVARAGKRRDRFLTEARVEERWLEEGTLRLSLDDYLRAVDAAITVTGDPAFGLHRGSKLVPPCSVWWVLWPNKPVRCASASR
jgi:hypothetical protein